MTCGTAPRSPPETRQPDPDPERTSYGSFFSFNDPDGNLRLVQEVTTRLPGWIDPTETAFASADDLENALWRTEATHVEHQKRRGGRTFFTGRTETRPGPPAMPPAWWRSRPGVICPNRPRM